MTPRTRSGPPRIWRTWPRCLQVTVNAPVGSTAISDFTALDVPEVRGLLRPVTAYLALTAPDGTNVALTSPLTVAVDGDRFLVLQPAASTSAPPDLAACARLLRDSFDAQPDAWVRSHVESSVTTSRTRVMTLVAVGIVGVIVGLDLLPGRTRLDRFDGAWERRQAARGSPFAA